MTILCRFLRNFPLFRLFARDVFQPSARFVPPQHERDLEDLVRREQDIDDGQRRVKGKRGDRAPQHRDPPQRSHVREQPVPRIPARAQDPHDEQTVERLQKDIIGEHDQHDDEILPRLIAQFEHAREDGDTAQHDRRAHRAHDRGHADQPLRIHLRVLFPAFADRLSDDDRRRVRHAHGQHDPELPHHLRRCVRARRRRAQVPDDRRNRRRPAAPEQFVEEYGHRIADIIFGELFVRAEEIAEAEAHGDARKRRIKTDDDKFEHARAERGDRRARNAHGGDRARAEDEQRVERDVHDEGGEIDRARNDDALHAAHDVEKHHAERHEEIGRRDDAQVFRPLRDDRRVV